MSLAESVGSLREAADIIREAYAAVATPRRDLDAALELIRTAGGDDPPSEVQEAIVHLRAAAQALNESKAFLTVGRETIETYCTAIGY